MTNFREEIRKILSLTGFQTRPVSYAYEEAADKLEELFQSCLRETEKAFGGCKKCYGKGYATQRRTVTGSPDFIGDRGFKIDKVWMNFCTCGRGKQLKSLLGRLKGLGGNKQ